MSFDEEDFLEVRRGRGRRPRSLRDRDWFKTVEEVFDARTVLTIYELMRRRIIDRMNGVVNAGKEARVYLGYDREGNRLAVKIYLVSTAVFRKGILKYIMGDPRFQGVSLSDTRRLIYMWTRKEFRNLKRMYDAGVRVPRPIAVLNNVLVMEFIGIDSTRAPLLVEAYRGMDYEELYEVFVQVMINIEKMYCRARLVHADMSEYNVMVLPGPEAVIIDVSQAVSLDHPNALDYLGRDIRNIYNFFNNEAGVETPEPEILYRGVVECRVKQVLGRSAAED